MQTKPKPYTVTVKCGCCKGSGKLGKMPQCPYCKGIGKREESRPHPSQNEQISFRDNCKGKNMHDHEQSLSDLIGKKVAHVVGYVSSEFGDDTLVFKITRIIYKDGSADSVNGEHDMPYIPADNNETWETL